MARLLVEGPWSDLRFAKGSEEGYAGREPLLGFFLFLAVGNDTEATAVNGASAAQCGFAGLNSVGH